MPKQPTRVPPRRLSDHLLAYGMPIVTLAQVAELMGLRAKVASDALVRLRRAGQMFSPAPGLYVAVPPQYRTWGVVPAMDFIDALMNAMGRQYYVGLLSAAELHGAAHQLPQVFQVMVNRPVRNRDLERVHLRFYTHTRITEVPTVMRNSATGQVRVATPAVTCLDLVSRPIHAGGLSNVATVLIELVEEAGISEEDLVHVAGLYPAASLRRLGWLLDQVGSELDTDVIHAALPDASGRAATLLDPSGPRRGHGDRRWGVVENNVVEPDL